MQPVTDWKNPNYTPIYVERARRLKLIHADPGLLAACKRHYAYNPWDFVNDWGMTNDPRRADLGLPTLIPFILWPRQTEYLHWLDERWRARERGIVEKSRDAGATWLSIAWACSYWLFLDGFVAAFGSRKEELVDRIGDDKSIFEKARVFLRNVPTVFMPPGFSWKTHSNYMRLLNPDTGAAIIGEAGDEIGRGGRSSIAFVDEAAFIEHQERVNSALSQNTNCQIDLSTYNRSGNEFYRTSMKFNNTRQKFVFDWRDDPRKDAAWYAKQKAERTEVEVAQEIDRDPNASIEGIFIPSKYVEAAVDAHKRLKFAPQGMRRVGFDPADVGDAKAVVGMHGNVVRLAKQKKQGDITEAIPWAFELADEFRADVLAYDADGMGAPSMKMSGRTDGSLRMAVIPYHGSGGVRDLNTSKGTAKKQKQDLRSGQSSLREGAQKAAADLYENFRAQSWSEALLAFQNTYKAIQALESGEPLFFSPDDLISIDSQSIEPNDLIQLKAELSRPMRKFAKSGKVLVESKAEMKNTRGVDSPNMADALIIARSVDARAVIDHQEKRSTVMVRPMRNPMNI